MGKDHRIPHFDPLDGGIEAECLFLLEAPGPKAVDSGFVSRNNPDETAKNFFELNVEAGLDRTKTVIWNVVPWYVGSSTKIRAVNASDIRTSQRALTALLDLLPSLRVVVFVGRKAANVRPDVAVLRPNLHLFECAHTSPMHINRAPQNRGLILAGLAQVAASLRTPSAGG
jgi:uracil-DNA glycosylase